MGVIERQGIKQSIVNYLGILIGALSTLFLYPIVRDEYGLVQFILGAALVVVPFVMLGTTSLMIRFFPEFKDDKNGHNGLLTLLSLVVFGGFLLFLLFLYFGKDWLIDYLTDEDTPVWYEEYFPFAVPLVFFISWSNLLKHYIHNFKRIVFPSIFDNLMPKIVLPLLVIGYLTDWLSLDFVVWSVVLMWGIIVLLQLGYIYTLKELCFSLDFSHLTRERLQRMLSFGAYGLFGGWGYVLVNRVDIFMVGLLLKDTGLITIYMFCVFASSFIDIPSKAVTNISSPLISQAWERKDLPYLADLYQKTSLVMYIVGLGLFLLIWLNVNDLYSIMKNGEPYREWIMAVLFLSLSKVVDMVTGVNGSIIAMSKFYKVNLVFLLVMAGVNIGLNYLLIPGFGLTGAALATLISMIIFNVLKYVLLFVKLKMQPFSLSTIWVTILATVVWFVVSSAPFTGIPFINLVLRSMLIIGLFGGAIYYFEMSKDVNKSIDNVVQQLKNIF